MITSSNTHNRQNSHLTFINNYDADILFNMNGYTINTPKGKISMQKETELQYVQIGLSDERKYMVRNGLMENDGTITDKAVTILMRVLFEDNKEKIKEVIHKMGLEENQLD